MVWDFMVVCVEPGIITCGVSRLYMYSEILNFGYLCSQRLTLQRRGKKGGGGGQEVNEGARKRERIIRRAALEFKNDMYGIRTPTSLDRSCVCMYCCLTKTLVAQSC